MPLIDALKCFETIIAALTTVTVNSKSVSEKCKQVVLQTKTWKK